MSNMDLVIESLQKKTKEATERWIDTKTGWNNFNYENYKNRDITKEIRQTIIKRGKKELRKATNITFVKNKPYRIEEFIERLLVIANDKLYNQFNVSDGKESIDLVYSDTNNINDIKELIELKEWNGPDTPIYALIEILKNYIILKHDKDFKIENLNCLKILAPAAYYKQFEITNDDFFQLIDKLKNENKINIEILYLDISLNEILQNLKVESEKETIYLEDYIDKINDIKELKIDEWCKISTIEDWHKVCS